MCVILSNKAEACLAGRSGRGRAVVWPSGNDERGIRWRCSGCQFSAEPQSLPQGEDMKTGVADGQGVDPDRVEELAC